MIYLSHIISGSKLPSLSNPGTASDLLSGKQLINENGEIVIGSIPSQSGTTITPGTSQKTACASGRYTTGNIYVAGDVDLVASNIKSGVNIFGVEGSLEGKETVTGTFDIDGAHLWIVTTEGFVSLTGYDSWAYSATRSDILKNGMLVFGEPQFRRFGSPDITISGGLTRMGQIRGGNANTGYTIIYAYSVTGDFSFTYHG